MHRIVRNTFITPLISSLAQIQNKTPPSQSEIPTGGQFREAMAAFLLCDSPIFLMMFSFSVSFIVFPLMGESEYQFPFSQNRM